MYETDMTRWSADGKGRVVETARGEFEARVETPYTLWCPDAAVGDVEIAFECKVTVADSAMLLMACARSWRGASLLETARQGVYDDYRCGDMECYTVGFNRAAHVSSDIQPNASTANVRRIGGRANAAVAGVDLRDRSPEGMARWRDWDTRSLLCSAREHASGLDRYYRYVFRFAAQRISVSVEGEELLTVVDHLPEPLCGGHVGLRNMTPGGGYCIRNLDIRDV